MKQADSLCCWKADDRHSLCSVILAKRCANREPMPVSVCPGAPKSGGSIKISGDLDGLVVHVPERQA